MIILPTTLFLQQSPQNAEKEEAEASPEIF
jgi:hypothetical protein